MTECTRNLEIEIPAGEVEREFIRIAQGFQKKARIPGFRPGKAPLSLVRQHFASKIREEAIEALVPAHLRAAFERESLEPVSTPTLDNLAFEPGSPLKFKASFEIMPPIELGDYRSIRTEMNVPPTGPADVEAALEALRQRHSSTEPSDAAQAEDGAIAVVEATPLPANESDVAPEAAPASVPPPALPQELSIEVGGADTLPQFSEALRGMRPDEERDLEVAYPADYPNAGLAGQTRKYHLKLKGIQKKTVPDLTDDFVKHATGADTVEELRRRIGENLTAERQHQARHQAEEAIVDQLLRQSPFPVPESLVDKQVEAKIERNLRGLADQGLDPRKLKLDWAKLRKRHEDSARREVRAALLLEKIADKENIAATPEAVEAEVQRAAEELQQPVDALRARLRDNGVLDRIENRIRQESVLEFLVRNATGTVAGSVEGAATQ